MPVPSWPADKGYPLAEGFRETFPKLVNRSSTDTGPAKQRRVTTAGPFTVEVTYDLTTAERAWLEDFYFGDAAGGGVWFEWRHPVTQATVLARFVEDSPPSYAPWRPTWLATVQLEVRR